MKGIILAGGSGTRLHPITIGVSKQMLPVYDKPMIYYPLSTLMLAGIKDILIISTPKDIGRYEELLGSGNQYGLKISYQVQAKPNGLAEAFILGEKFIGSSPVALILGDNLFYGEGLSDLLLESKNRIIKDNLASIFAYSVMNPNKYGVVNFDDSMNPIEIVEKPDQPLSNYAVVGLYFYPNNVIDIAKKVKPSKRGELEITSINNEFLSKDQLFVERMGRGFAWFDTGTADSLMDASYFIKTLEKRHGLKIGCIEEIAHDNNLISSDQFKALISSMADNPYSRYLMNKLRIN
jgi:glucose-1-phosphate thymidylyltransferase